MDRKSIIILVVSALLLMAWYPLTNRLFPPVPVPKTNTVSRATNTAAGADGTNGLAASSGSVPNSAAIATPAATVIQPPEKEETLALETPEAIYTFSSYGGGLKLVELKKFADTVNCFGKKKANTNAFASLNTRAPVPAFTVISDFVSTNLESFRLYKTGDVVRAERSLPNGLTLIKEFRPGSNYMVQASVRYENHATQAVNLPEREFVVGTSTPVGHRDESQMLGLEWYNGRGAEKITEPWFQNQTMGCSMFGGNPRSVYRAESTNVVWAAVHNQFFTMIALPSTNTPVSGVVGRRVALPPPGKDVLEDDPSAFTRPVGYQTALVMPPLSVAPQSYFEYHYELFAGPKEYKTLSRLPSQMDLVMGFGGFFGFFAKALLLSMNALHATGLAYGLAIIVITVIIKLLFWPLTTASTRSMKRMAALQPQMKAIQEKYKDDPRKMNSKLMEFMKENKVSPMGGCLPVLLQIPVFFGFYRMLQSAIELRGASFLWACDLSQPDTIFSIAGFPVNPLPILMGGTMLWQAHLTPPSPGMDPAQQKMMKYMPLIMVVFLYNFSAGLALYWTTQNLLSIAQMKLTKTNPAGPNAPVPAKIAPPKKK